MKSYMTQTERAAFGSFLKQQVSCTLLEGGPLLEDQHFLHATDMSLTAFEVLSFDAQYFKINTFENRTLFK